MTFPLLMDAILACVSRLNLGRAIHGVQSQLSADRCEATINGDLDVRDELRSISLRHVLTFLVVADLRSFRAAAEHLRISQSALSVRVQQLEGALGVPLLHRTTRVVTLTAQGVSAQASLRRVCSDLRRLVRDLRDEAALRRGLVTVAVLPSLAATLLPLVVTTFAADHPGIEIRLRDADSKTALAMVRRGEVDMGIPARNGSLDGLLFTSCSKTSMRWSCQQAIHIEVRESGSAWRTCAINSGCSILAAWTFGKAFKFCSRRPAFL